MITATLIFSSSIGLNSQHRKLVFLKIRHFKQSESRYWHCLHAGTPLINLNINARYQFEHTLESNRSDNLLYKGILWLAPNSRC